MATSPNTVKPGSRVRVTLGDSAVVGEVLRVGNAGVDVHPDGAEDYNAFSSPPWTVEVLPEPVPAWMLEPGAVCKDKDGVAWQRDETSDDWRASGYPTYTADDLIAERGPLTRLVPVPVVPEDVRGVALDMSVNHGGYGMNSLRVARWVLDLAGQHG